MQPLRPRTFDQQVGEAPVGYGYVDLTEDDLSYTISGLNPGISYTVFVSALNRHGQGARAAVATGGVTLPLTVPSAPTNVAVATKGYSETEGDGIGDSQVKMSILGSTQSCCGGALITKGRCYRRRQFP